jgi:hypothetical protein
MRSSAAGALMMGPAGLMDWDNFNESFPAYLTIAVMPLTYSIANGVVAGLLCYVLIDVCTRPWLSKALHKLCGRSMRDDDLAIGLVSDGGKRRTSVTASPHAVCRPTTPIISTPSHEARTMLEVSRPSAAI